jgi:hypothetical protein
VTPGAVKARILVNYTEVKNILVHVLVLYLGSGTLRNTRATGGFLKTAHTENRILVQIFGSKIQAQNSEI